MTESVSGDNRKIKNSASAEEILRLNPLFAEVDLSGIDLFVKEFKRRDEISELQEKTYCIGVIGSGEADVYALSRHEEACTGSVNVSTQHEGNIWDMQCVLSYTNAHKANLQGKVSGGIHVKGRFQEIVKQGCEIA